MNEERAGKNILIKRRERKRETIETTGSVLVSETDFPSTLCLS